MRPLLAALLIAPVVCLAQSPKAEKEMHDALSSYNQLLINYDACGEARIRALMPNTVDPARVLAKEAAKHCVPSLMALVMHQKNTPLGSDRNAGVRAAEDLEARYINAWTSYALEQRAKIKR